MKLQIVQHPHYPFQIVEYFRTNAGTTQRNVRRIFFGRLSSNDKIFTERERARWTIIITSYETFGIMYPGAPLMSEERNEIFNC